MFDNFKYAGCFLHLHDHPYVQEVAKEDLSEFYTEFVAESDAMAIYYAPNGCLEISLREPGVTFKADTTCSSGQLLIRLKVEHSAPTLWHAALCSHGEVYRKTSILLLQEYQVLRTLRDRKIVTDFPKLLALAEEERVRKRFPDVLGIGHFQHTYIIPDLNEYEEVDPVSDILQVLSNPVFKFVFQIRSGPYMSYRCWECMEESMRDQHFTYGIELGYIKVEILTPNTIEDADCAGCNQAFGNIEE